MKKVFFALFAVILTTSLALAAWQDVFSTNYAEKGLGTAVHEALAAGASPGEIIDLASSIDGIHSAPLVTAMCKGGLTPGDLQDFLKKLGMNPASLKKACEKGRQGEGKGIRGDIAYDNRFPGSNPPSASESRGTSSAPTPASGHTF